ncbi:cell adhesion molecule CEACAM5-like [Ptychodera flava]|uniref:cell adhesion molecule CEACAM5-like n=1 Tax=Ptychodera flava TaxID=63121 RepID=UPI00396A2A59
MEYHKVIVTLQLFTLFVFPTEGNIPVLPVKWRKTATDKIVPSGATVRFACRLERELQNWPRWRHINHQGQERLVSAGIYLDRESCSNCEISGNHLNGEYDLIIRNVDANVDAGQWMCEAIGGEPKSTYSATLTIVDETMTCSADNIGPENTVVSGDNITLTCYSNTEVLPGDVKWTVNGRNSNVSGQAPLIFNTQITKSAIGDVFDCRYNDDADLNTQTCKYNMSFNVQYPPEAIFISSTNDGIITENDKFEATCRSESNPEPSYEWFDSRGNSVSPGPILSIEQTKRQRAGTYRCEATNELYDGRQGRAVSTTELIIQYPPEIRAMNTVNIAQGESLRLECNVDANPEARVQWILPNATENDGNMLVFTQLGRGQAGSYTCTAVNMLDNGHLGRDSKTVLVNVKYPPIQVSTTQYTANIGDSVTLKIDVESYPTRVEFSKWSKNGSEFPSTNVTSTSCSLHIDAVTEKDFGIYEVYGTNKFRGPQQLTVELREKEKLSAPALSFVTISFSRFYVRIEGNYISAEDIVYIIEFKESGAIASNWEDNRQSQLAASISGLRESTVYDVRAFASNEFSRSDASNITKIETCGKPLVRYDSISNEISWPGYTKKSCTHSCVEIESFIQDEWTVLEKCCDPLKLKYGLQESQRGERTFRIRFCQFVNECDHEYFMSVAEAAVGSSSSSPNLYITIGVPLVVAVVLIGLGLFAYCKCRKRGSEHAYEEYAFRDPAYWSNTLESNHYEFIGSCADITEKDVPTFDIMGVTKVDCSGSGEKENIDAVDKSKQVPNEGEESYMPMAPQHDKMPTYSNT